MGDFSEHFAGTQKPTTEQRAFLAEDDAPESVPDASDTPESNLKKWKAFIASISDSGVRDIAFNYLVRGLDEQEVRDRQYVQVLSLAMLDDPNGRAAHEYKILHDSVLSVPSLRGALSLHAKDIFVDNSKKEKVPEHRQNRVQVMLLSALAQMKKEAEGREEKVKERTEEIYEHFKAREVPILWPEKDGGVGASLEQGQSGDCYLVSALDALKHHPNPAALFSRIMWRERGTLWGVQVYDEDKAIAGDPRSGWVKIFVDEKKDLRDDGLLYRGSLGDRILERAYVRFLHSKRGGKAGNTMDREHKQHDEEGREKNGMLYEGGFPYRAIFSFLGPRYEKFRTYSYRGKDGELISGNFDPMLRKVEQDPDGYYFVSTRKREDAKPNQQRLFLPPIYPKWFVPRHAFRVERVDMQAGICLLRNPHNTSKPITVPLDELKQYIQEIYGVIKQKDPKRVPAHHPTRSI